MANVRILDIIPKRFFSYSNKQYSDLLPIYHPHEDEMRQVFDKFDADGDRKISQEEYKAILLAIGKPRSIVKEVNKIFQVADVNKDGYIDFNEFMALHNHGVGVRTMDIKNAFRAFDVDGDGKISPEEVLEILTRLGEKFTLPECRRMVSAYDTDKDGFICMDDFMSMMTGSMICFDIKIS